MGEEKTRNTKIRRGSLHAKLFENHLIAVEEDLESKDRQNDFIESIREFYDTNDFVTEKQAEAVERFYHNV